MSCFTEFLTGLLTEPCLSYGFCVRLRGIIASRDTSQAIPSLRQMVHIGWNNCEDTFMQFFIGIVLCNGLKMDEHKAYRVY